MSKFIEFPKPKLETEAVSPPVTFKDFFFCSMAGNSNEAAKILESIFKTDPYTARGYTNFYMEKLRTDATTTMKSLQIKESIDNNDTNGALSLITECFGTSAIQAVLIFTALTAYTR